MTGVLAALLVGLFVARPAVGQASGLEVDEIAVDFLSSDPAEPGSDVVSGTIVFRQDEDAAGSGTVSRIMDVVLPGRAQLRHGRNTRGTVLAISALSTTAGLGIAQWLYGRKVDLANSFEGEYVQSIPSLLPLAAHTDDQGYLTRTSIYRDWTEAYDAARTRRSIRNVAGLVVAGVYAVHLADLILSDRGSTDSDAGQVSFRPVIMTPSGSPAAGLSATVSF